MTMPGFTADTARGASRGRYTTAPSRAASPAAIVPARPCCFAGCIDTVCDENGFDSAACHHCLSVCTPSC
jgi:hypothetical protein